MLAERDKLGDLLLKDLYLVVCSTTSWPHHCRNRSCVGCHLRSTSAHASGEQYRELGRAEKEVVQVDHVHQVARPLGYERGPALLDDRPERPRPSYQPLPHTRLEVEGVVKAG